MRNITSHVVEGDAANHQIEVAAHDGHNGSGAGHIYVISADLTNNPGYLPINPEQEILILFQNGPIKDAGVNGLTNEALLAVLIDRTEIFQQGPFACEENARALTGLRDALDAFQIRTRRRIAKGIEGTNAVDAGEGAAQQQQDDSVRQMAENSEKQSPPPHIPVDETLDAMDHAALSALAVAHGHPNVTDEGGRSLRGWLSAKRDSTGDASNIDGDQK